MTTEREYEIIVERLTALNMAIIALSECPHEDGYYDIIRACDLLLAARERYIDQHAKMVEGWFEIEDVTE